VAPRHLLALVVVMVSLAAPAAAEAATLSIDGTTVVFRDTDPTTVNSVYLISVDGTDHHIGDQVASIDDDGSGCTDTGGELFHCPNATAFRVETGGGNDEVNAQIDSGNILSIPLTADLGTGTGFANGGLAGDTLRGGPAADTLNGGGGDDSLDGGFGADWLQGDAGLDVVNYSTRTETVRVDLGGPGGTDGADGSLNDGPAGSRDMVQPDVEGAVGGSGDDVLKPSAAPTRLNGGGGDDSLVGTQGADMIEGGDGADSIVPLAGMDSVFAGAGIDHVGVRDGEVDTVDCGADPDHAVADSVDALTSCEPPPPSAPVVETVVERVVEREQIVTPSRVLFDLAYTFSAGRRVTTLRNVEVDAEPGSRLTASCRTSRGRRCRGTRDLARASASTALRLRGFENKRLPVGAKLTIQVTKDGAIGAVKTLTIRRRRAPSVRTLCLPPGAARPVAC
jgi:hypothetical protein